MTDLVQFAILGLGAGAAYTLLAQGVVLVHRGSGVVNLAHGALATVGAHVAFLTLRDEAGWSLAPAFVVAVSVVAAIGCGFQVMVLRALRGAAPIVRLIATLGLLLMLQAGVQAHYGNRFHRVDGFLPDGLYRWGDVVVQQDRLILATIAAAATAALWATTRFTRLGLAITASAESERAVALLGWSPDMLAMVTWTVGGALAGSAGILVAPVTGLSPEAFTLVMTVGGLAAALLGRFRSFPLTLVGGLLLGIGESEATRYQDDLREILGLATLTGMARTLPFLVILAVLVLRGRSLPLRSHVHERHPASARSAVRPAGLGTGVAIACAGAVAVALGVGLLGNAWSSAFGVSFSVGVVVLSVVVLTGFAGQLSLGQYAVGGLGALCAARLVADGDWPVELAVVGGVAAAVPVGLLFALPALRTRGVDLAVVTLGLGVTIQEVVFANPSLTGNPVDGGTRIGPVSLLGIDVNAVDHPGRWAAVCLAVLVVAGLVVANLRRSRTGRRLMIVRANERAAASLGISVPATKAYAFGVSAAIAASGAILLAFRDPIVTYGRFNAFASISLMAQAVIGGLGGVLGAFLGGGFATGGIATRALDEAFVLGPWEVFVVGALLTAVVVASPSGLAGAVVRLAAMRRARAGRRGRARTPERLPDVPTERVRPMELVVRDLAISFGGVAAVRGVSLMLAPGEVVGVIGPNGAGKTTLIDAVTGFVRPSSGHVALNGRSIGGLNAPQRARRGVRRSFQSFELLDDVSVRENIHAGADGAPALSWLTDLVWPGRHPLPAGAVSAVRLLGLSGHLDSLPGELPGGGRRLVGIARAIASGPSVLLLDEPAAGLDAVERTELAASIRRLADDRGMGVLLVEHDVDLVTTVCDRVLALAAGAVIAEGSPQRVLDDPAVVAAFLGVSARQAQKAPLPERS